MQGHLYITDNYFAFYSNVFGFVTKLLIPVVSVAKISKEKTVKIIPNAIGVATADERHVFGSFMSREAAYRLMINVWRPTGSPASEVPETPTSTAKAAAVASSLALMPDIEASECSIEEDSSCSVSGNESPKEMIPAAVVVVDPSLLLRQRIVPLTPAALESSSSSAAGQMPDLTVRGSLLARDDVVVVGGGVPGGGGVSTTTTLITNDDSATINRRLAAATHPDSPAAAAATSGRRSHRLGGFVGRLRAINWRFPTDIHIVYLGVILAVILALFSGFLLYRIMDIQARTNNLDHKWVS